SSLGWSDAMSSKNRTVHGSAPWMYDNHSVRVESGACVHRDASDRLKTQAWAAMDSEDVRDWNRKRSSASTARNNRFRSNGNLGARGSRDSEAGCAVFEDDVHPVRSSPTTQTPAASEERRKSGFVCYTVVTSREITFSRAARSDRPIGAHLQTAS